MSDVGVDRPGSEVKVTVTEDDVTSKELVVTPVFGKELERRGKHGGSALEQGFSTVAVLGVKTLISSKIVCIVDITNANEEVGVSAQGGEELILEEAYKGASVENAGNGSHGKTVCLPQERVSKCEVHISHIKIVGFTELVKGEGDVAGVGGRHAFAKPNVGEAAAAEGEELLASASGAEVEDPVAGLTADGAGAFSVHLLDVAGQSCPGEVRVVSSGRLDV
mmetsp:Transcript_39860/g.93541  ORF Transcript_39860/g.93541 Transcript_39860/m.93541 type:complete len:222 (+) Transcript_39860:1523-2188(+)